VAVYDLGGGTFDAAVLRKKPSGSRSWASRRGSNGWAASTSTRRCSPRRQGHRGQARELDEDDPQVIAAVARLREECVQAKEALSSDTDVSIPVLLPNLSTEVRLTRAELEAMVRPALHDSIEALKRAIRSANVTPEQLQAVLLVGGSSRMPIVAQLVGAELGRPVAVDAHPKHAVPLGAAWLASGALSNTSAPRAVAARRSAPPRPPPPRLPRPPPPSPPLRSWAPAGRGRAPFRSPGGGRSDAPTVMGG
jgi:molecular chaperone DnaK (HSP70)